MDTTSAPAARAALAPVADGTTPALTEAELKKKAVREKSNQRRKEKRDRDRAAAAALAAAADDAPPPPKKTSQKRKSPEEGTIPAPKPTAAPKKARVEPSTSVTSQTSFTPSLGVASVLTEAGVVLNVTATMNALATFSNVDDVVGANMDYCTKVITSEKGAFQAWMKTNTIIFYYLAEAIIDGTRFIASLTPDEEAAVASGKSTDVDDDVALIDDPEQLEFLRDFMDVEAKTSTSPAVRVTEYTLPTSAFYRELIVTVTSKGKTTPSKFLTALQKHGAVTRDTLLLATKETSPATTTDVELAKRLGMRLAAIKYVFGQAK